MAYLAENELDPEFEKYPTDRLDALLSKFYAEARNTKGELYKKATLFSFRYGLSRHLGSRGDLINGTDFKHNNGMFQAVIKELKQQGNGSIDHHPPIIDKRDLQKLYKYFDLNDPKKLQEKVFLDVMLHFGRRGRENLRTLKVQDFAVTADAKGLKYVYMCHDEVTKNHQLDNNTADGHMFEVPGKYLSSLSINCVNECILYNG